MAFTWPTCICVPEGEIKQGSSSGLGWQMPSLLNLCRERERETVVFSNADTNRIGDDILLGWSGLSWSEGEEEGRAGGCGAESVSTVIGKGCLWLVIYILVLVDGICRGYVYSYTAWLTVYCCKNCLNNRESQKTLSSHEKINTTAVTISIKTLES